MSLRVPHVVMNRAFDLTSPVDRATVRLWADVTDRRGWRQEWDDFDANVKAEILERWRTIIADEFML